MAKYKVTVYLDRYQKSRIVDVEDGLLDEDLDEIGRDVANEMVYFRMEKEE
jgi:hypothetical protein